MKRMLAPLVGALLAGLTLAGCGGHEVTTGHAEAGDEWVAEPVTGPLAPGRIAVVDDVLIVGVVADPAPRKGTGPVLGCVSVMLSNKSYGPVSTRREDWRAVTSAGTTKPSVLFDGVEPLLSQELPAHGDQADGYVCFDMPAELIAGVEYGGRVTWEIEQ